MNHALFTFINGYAGKNGIVDTAAVALAEYLPLIFIAFLGYLWFFRKESRGEVLMTCVAALFALTMNVAIGLLYFHPRPFMDHPVNQLIAHAAETSFPSDHATFMLALSLMLAICRRTRTAGLLFVVLSFAGGFARVFCGVHYPLDIAGSFLVALLASGLVRSLHSRLSSCSQAVLGKHDIIAAKKLVIARRQ